MWIRSFKNTDQPITHSRNIPPREFCIELLKVYQFKNNVCTLDENERNEHTFFSASVSQPFQKNKTSYNSEWGVVKC